MIDIREEFEKILNQYGYDIVLVKRDLRFRCSCYSERSGEPNATCDICFGTGYKVTLYKCKTRRKISSVPETLTNSRQVLKAGSSTRKAYVYYLTYDMEPKEGDLILEIEWQDEKPISIKEKLFISQAEPMKGREGRVEFYQVYCKVDYLSEYDDQAISKY